MKNTKRNKTKRKKQKSKETKNLGLQQKQNSLKTITSKSTAGKRLPSIYSKVNKIYGWERNTYNLDIGGGPWKILTNKLRQHRVKNLVYDPYNVTKTRNNKVLNIALKNKVETVTISNVLNVVPFKKDRIAILCLAKKYIKKDGRIYITIYEGDKSGIGKINKDSFQQNTKLRWYLSTVKKIFKNTTIRNGMIISIV